MYPRAPVKNQATRSLERIIDNRLDQRSTSLVFAGEGASPSNQTLLIDSDLAHLEQELRWRLERRHSGPVGTVQPFVPGLDAAEQGSMVLDAFPDVLINLERGRHHRDRAKVSIQGRGFSDGEFGVRFDEDQLRLAFDEEGPRTESTARQEDTIQTV